jgi:hypothetical protein
MLSYCAQQVSGSLQWLLDVDHMEKSFVFAGMPARNGVHAALLAEAGFTGVPDALDAVRELNKKVIGVGVKASTSALLPPACDEFLFYENLEGVEPGRPKGTTQPQVESDVEPQPELESLITTTLAGLSRSSGGEVLASSLKRAMLRKDSTFSEADHGYRAFGELLRDLESKGVIELSDGPGRGDPVVEFPSEAGGEDEAFDLLVRVVNDLSNGNRQAFLSGLKNQLRKQNPDFSEKKFGYGGFLQFCKGAARRGLIELDWDDSAEDYRVTPA